jgi:hypothetical protein
MKNPINIRKLYDQPLSEDYYYFLSPFGLGDTLVLLGLKRKLESLYGKKIFFLLKESHLFLADLFGITDVIPIKEFRLPPDSPILIEMGKKCEEPEVGKVFAAHFALHPIGVLLNQQAANSSFAMLDHYLAMFKLPWNTLLEFPSGKIEKNISKIDLSELKSKVETILKKNVEFEDLALIIPEVRSFSNLKNMKFWNDVVDKAKQENLVPIQSTTNKKFLISNLPNIELSLNELILLAFKSGLVISMRNGLCDVIWEKGEKLIAIYPDLNTYKFGRIKSLFPSSKTKEFIYPQYLYES